jgi:hypothetical protein
LQLLVDQVAKDLHPQALALFGADAAAIRGNSLYTPQMVLNGRVAIIGHERQSLVTALSAQPLLSGARISVAGGTVEAKAQARPADLWLVRYDPKSRAVKVKAGENAGRTLPHRNIVIAIERLGPAGGKPLLLPAERPGEARAILLQEANSGPVLDALRL